MLKAEWCSNGLPVVMISMLNDGYRLLGRAVAAKGVVYAIRASITRVCFMGIVGTWSFKAYY